MPFLRYPVAAFTGLALLLALAAFWPTGRQVYKDVQLYGLSLDAPREVRLGTRETLLLTTGANVDPNKEITIVAGMQMVVTVDSLCMTIDPPGETVQAILIGTEQKWQWQLTPRNDMLGPCEVDVVVRLRREKDERIIWVKQLQIATATVMGLPAPTAQAADLTGSVLGFILLAILQLKVRSSRKTK